MAKPCRVSYLYAAMPEEDRETFRELIQNPGLSGLLIARALKSAGYGEFNINRHSVEHYRRKLEAGTATL